MGVYLRTSLRAGPFRFNLSRSGIGISVGVPGFRIGTSPRGNYVRLGKSSGYFATTSARARQHGSGMEVAPPARPALPLNDPVVLQELDGVPVRQLVAASPCCRATGGSHATRIRSPARHAAVCGIHACSSGQILGARPAASRPMPSPSQNETVEPSPPSALLDVAHTTTWATVAARKPAPAITVKVRRPVQPANSASAPSTTATATPQPRTRTKSKSPRTTANTALATEAAPNTTATRSSVDLMTGVPAAVPTVPWSVAIVAATPRRVR